MTRMTYDRENPIVVMGAEIRDSEANFNNRYLRPYASRHFQKSPGRLGDADSIARTSRSVPALERCESVRPRASI